MAGELAVIEGGQNEERPNDVRQIDDECLLDDFPATSKVIEHISDERSQRTRSCRHPGAT